MQNKSFYRCADEIFGEIGKCLDNVLYYINGIELPCLSHCWDLGVIKTCCPLHFTYNILLLQPISGPTVSYGVLCLVM